MTAFQIKKKQILDSLLSPLPDLSPKGGPDIQIIPLLNLINSHPLLVSTSSCAGRVALYAEGQRGLLGDTDEPLQSKQSASLGGKGGGKWLFVTHDEPNIHVEDWNTLFGEFEVEHQKRISTNRSSEKRRYVHFKFEPMILHILCATPDIALKFLGVALACGFRESGFNGNILAIRCSLRIDAPIGYLSESGDSMIPMVDLDYLSELMIMAKERFWENKTRIERLYEGVQKSLRLGTEVVETKEERRLRKRAEGLRKQSELVNRSTAKSDAAID